MPFAVVFIPDFPVQAVLRVEPDGFTHLLHRAIVILDGPESLLRAVAVNEMARRFGIEIGMPKLKIETSSQVVLKRRSASLENTAQQALIDCASAFSPRVESTAAGIITLDIAGCVSLFGSVEQLATQLAANISTLHFAANVAVAENPDAALFGARGFSGVTVIPRGEEATRLGVLPLRILTDSRVMLATFDGWGIRSFKELALMPLPALKKRLGNPGVQLQKLALGQVNRLLVPVEPIVSFEEVYDLEHESQEAAQQDSTSLEWSPEPPDIVEFECNQELASTPGVRNSSVTLRSAAPGQFDPILFILNRLLDLLLARLRSRSLATDELHVRFELETHEKDEARCKATGADPCSYYRTVKLPVPTQDAKALFKLIQLDVSAHPPCAPIRKIFLSAEPAMQRTVQLGFFSANALEPEKLEILLARIRDVIGSEDNEGTSRLGIPGIVDTHLPGDFTVQPFSSEAPGDVESLSPVNCPIAALRMFRPALPARVSLDGQGCPVTVQFRAGKGKVVAAGGPDLLSGAWWESEKRWERSCWVVAVRFTSGMGLLTLYKDIESNGWFVSGVVN
jgi:protein ImuB